MASSSKQLHKNLHETHWLTQITQLLQSNELQTALKAPTSIFKISDSITITNPQAYFPHHMALGPYNHFKNDLYNYKMELYKLQSTIQAAETFQLPPLTQILDQLKQFDIKIRSCFDKFLDIEPEALAWIFVLDGLFLVQLLTISNNDEHEYRRSENVVCLESPFPSFVEQTLYSCLIDENLMSKEELVKDILMLENQIPLVVLQNILPQNLGNNLHLLFFKFCDSVSFKKLPFYDIPDFIDGYTDLSKILEQSHHLLHFFYLLILDRNLSPDQPVGWVGPSFLVELLNVLASVLQIGFLQELTEAVGWIQSLLGLLGKSSSTGKDVINDSPPLIPSASELRRVGVKFEGNYEDFHESIGFVQEPKNNVRLRMPTITINAFSEVVFRNMVAFEEASNINPPCFSYYVALMSGLISTTKDIKILKQADVIRSHSGSEEELVKLFDGLRNVLELHQLSYNNSDRIMKMSEIRIAKDINCYYESCWKVKAKRLFKRYINPIFKVIFLIVVILLIVVVVVRTFCGWFGCSRILHVLSAVAKF